MICQTILSVCLLLLLTNYVNVSADMTDADQASDSDTSGTSDVEMDLDNKDPNLHNPQARQGYGIPGQSPKFGATTTKTTTRKPKTTTPPRSLGEQSIRAALQLGIVVGSTVPHYSTIVLINRNTVFLSALNSLGTEKDSICSFPIAEWVLYRKLVFITNKQF